MPGLLQLVALSCVVTVLLTGALPAIAADVPHRVLVLYSNGRLLPANIDFDRGLRAAFGASNGTSVMLFDEFLDMPRFGGDDYERTMESYLRAKYASQPPDLVVAASDDALRFILVARARICPGVPVIHAAASAAMLESIGPLPPDVIGAPVEYDFSGTIEQALRWHPRARRLVIVTGASTQDRKWETRLRGEAPRFAPRVEIEFLAGLPTPELLERLRALRSDSVVFTTGYFLDGAGHEFLPREAVRLMAGASGAPVYGAFQPQLGMGIVGGRFPDFEEIGRQAGELANAWLSSGGGSAPRVPAGVPARLHVDWRQVVRWDIDEQAIPGDTVIHFREPTFLEQYRNETIIALVVLLLQAGLIGVLLAERRRRRNAEMAELAKRLELAHVSRLAVAGELTGSIAHEINQPLGAILSNADAAELILEAGGDRRSELRQILADIRRDDLRASEVIRRLRTLLARHEVERQPFQLNDAVHEVESLLRAEARRRHVTLDVRPAAHDVTVVGDRVQIQQVLINLILNAMDAVTDMPEGRRIVGVSVERSAAGVDVAVRDRGEGIAADQLPKLFDSFFTTKKKGMGLGLSIARSIVEAHGGNIRAENVPGVGAGFHVELPVAASSAESSRGVA
jgi:signal transduction histidine kinase